jgi:hypothetical protein
MYLRFLLLIAALASSSLLQARMLYDPEVWDTALREATSEEERRNVECLMRWNADVWGDGQYDLVPTLVAETYTRHQGNGTTIVTPMEYLAVIKAWRARNVVFVSSGIKAQGDKIWTQWSAALDSENGEREISRALQVYRFEDGRLVETWVSMTQGQGAWPNDGLAQWGKLDEESPR